MFIKSNKGYYFWEEFSKVYGVIHGISSRKFGDMNWKNQDSFKNLKLFCRILQIEPTQTVRMEQVHGNNVRVVDYRTSIFRHSGKRSQVPSGTWRSASRISMIQRDSGQARMTLIDSTDGLISSQKNVFLLVTFADCVPVFLLDKNKGNFGIAHAGWKGVYKEIVKNVLEKMVEKGSRRSDIMVGLGPSIRVCCYNVYKDRAESFKNKFPKMKGITKVKNGRIFLDLIKIVKFQLKCSGILDRNILDSKLCTKDNVLDFYSFRKEGGTESFGLSSGIIGRI